MPVLLLLLYNQYICLTKKHSYTKLLADWQSDFRVKTPILPNQ